MPEAEVWIDDLRTHETPDQGYVMLSWDDGMLDYYETAAPLHDEYGFQTVQAPVPRWVEQGEDGTMSRSELIERQEAGDQIVVHGTHDPMAETDESESEGRGRGGQAVVHRQRVRRGELHRLPAQQLRQDEPRANH